MNKEENKCKWLNIEEGCICMRSFSGCTINCSYILRYDRNGNVSLPCDGAGYEEDINEET